MSGCGDWSSIDSYLAAHKSFCHMHRTAICWCSSSPDCYSFPGWCSSASLLLLSLLLLSTAALLPLPLALRRCCGSWGRCISINSSSQRPAAMTLDPTASVPPPSAAFLCIPGNPLLLPWAVFVLRPRATDSVIYCS